MKQNNSRKKQNEDNFDIQMWVDTHRPHHVFMKFCEFGSNENMTILYKIYSCDTFKSHLII
jgi:hypothetical protein